MGNNEKQIGKFDNDSPIKTKKKRNTKGIWKNVGSILASLGAIAAIIKKNK